MGDIHQIIRNIRGRENLRENLDAYQENMRRIAARFSLDDLALQALSLYDAAADDEKPVRFQKEITGLLEAYLDGTASLQDVIVLRRENMAEMQTVSRTIDAYVLAEYLLNRAEHRFIGEKALPEDYADLAFTEEIMTYISLQKDEARGIAVSDILGELPVRMTKERFFETLKNRLGIYCASDTQAFDNMVSLIRSAAGMDLADGGYAEAGKLEKILAEFAEKKSADLSEDDFNRLQEELKEISLRLNLDSEHCSEAAAVLNDLEILLLSSGLETDSPEKESALKILRIVTELLKKLPETDAELYGEAMSLCEDLEGRLEDALEDYRECASFSEDIVTRYEGEIAGAGLASEYGAIGMIRDLRSDSLFAEEHSEIPPAYALSTDEFNRRTDELILEFSELFRGKQKGFGRAVMGRVLSLIPPVFKSAEELENYIYASLSSCRNTEEKLGCIELVRKLMER